MKIFYIQPYGVACERHRNRPSTYQVKSQGEVYRYACTEACANQQKAELEKAWNK